MSRRAARGTVVAGSALPVVHRAHDHEGGDRMSRRRTEETAAQLLTAWTDSDTAMQIVGTSLGVFGVGLLDPEIVLAKETPLRNALFDVLLSLVEGGALDVRPTGDGHYAFRWRADYAVGALTPEMATTVDIEVPSPYLAELTEARRERDAALLRAESAEALAGERTAAAITPREPAKAETIDLVALEADGAENDEEEDDDEYEWEYYDEDDELDDGDEEEAGAPETPVPDAGEVVYLGAASANEEDPGRSKWSPYTLDKPRSPLSSAERFAKQG
jgi:hypothetical protein